jgi:diacylglycerol kinase (ATP)
MKVLFVINPVAGGKDHEDTIASIKQLATERGVTSDFLLTSGKQDEKNLKIRLDRFSPDLVIAGGGDGTIRQVATELINYKLPLGILPLGSANGLATALEIPNDPEQALISILESKKIKQMDMLRFNNDHLSIHVADIGANALLVKKYEENGERGMMGYAKNLLSSIKESDLLKMIVRTNEGIVTKEGYMMAFANAHKYGTGVHISEGSVSDGKFEICNVEKLALDDAIKAGLTILNVFLDKNMFSDVITCTEAEVEVSKKTHFQIDGEYMGEIDHLKIEILPGCVKLVK